MKVKAKVSLFKIQRSREVISIGHRATERMCLSEVSKMTHRFENLQKVSGDFDC